MASACLTKSASRLTVRFSRSNLGLYRSFLHGTIPVQIALVEKHETRLERKEERVLGNEIGQPLGQVAGHDDQRVLKLTVGLGR
ncbi:hypothetical protein BpHYR1_052194 [Brachionus plicatilis]|uniref:Uncharacterized protein n=1 Tax=Brachionus plicatilis TaxID=10195 RepID=A0A3M7S4I4_BRAPC|nr:hypothetical protein BpHYR1_052194 [Brachionus plicatilis]